MGPPTHLNRGVTINHLKIVRSLDAPVERVWGVVGNPGVSPGPGVDVEVGRPGASDGSGLTRVVKVGRVIAHEEIVGVEPGRVVRYRATKGVPARDYEGRVSVDESPSGGTTVSWNVQFRPIVPGTGWLISLLTKRTLNRVLDAVTVSSRSRERTIAGVSTGIGG